MSDPKDVIHRAYDGIPKEVGLVLIFDLMPVRSIKYYWYKLIRKVTR